MPFRLNLYRGKFCSECGCDLARNTGHLCDHCDLMLGYGTRRRRMILLGALLLAVYLLLPSEPRTGPREYVSPEPSVTAPADGKPSSVIELETICGARTKKGTPCRRKTRQGSRCYQHTGLPSMLDSHPSNPD